MGLLNLYGLIIHYSTKVFGFLCKNLKKCPGSNVTYDCFANDQKTGTS